MKLLIAGAPVFEITITVARDFTEYDNKPIDKIEEHKTIHPDLMGILNSLYRKYEDELEEIILWGPFTYMDQVAHQISNSLPIREECDIIVLKCPTDVLDMSIDDVPNNIQELVDIINGRKRLEDPSKDLITTTRETGRHLSVPEKKIMHNLFKQHAKDLKDVHVPDVDDLLVPKPGLIGMDGQVLTSQARNEPNRINKGV